MYALACSRRVYTVYGLEGYQKLYSLDHGAVQEVKVGFVSLFC